MSTCWGIRQSYRVEKRHVHCIYIQKNDTNSYVALITMRLPFGFFFSSEKIEKLSFAVCLLLQNSFHGCSSTKKVTHYLPCHYSYPYLAPLRNLKSYITSDPPRVSSLSLLDKRKKNI